MEFKKIIIVLVLIYSVVVIERVLNNELNQTELIMQHNKDYMQMREDLDVFNNKINEYEIKMLQNKIGISGFSNDELDSLFTKFNPK